MNEMSLTTMYGDYAIAKENGYEKSFAQFKNDFGGGPIDYSQEEEIEIKEFANGGGVGSMMQPKRGLVNGPGGYAGSIENIINAAYPQGNFLDIREISPTQKDYNINATKDLVENLPGGVLRDMLAPAAAATLSVPYDTIQGIGRAVDNSNIDTSPYGGIVDDMETPRGPSLSDLSQAINAENPLSSMVERTIGASAPLAERLSGMNFGMSQAAASEITPSNNIQSSGMRSMADVAGPSTIDRFSNSVGPTPNEITDRNRGQIGSNNLAQDLAGVARNTTQTEFDSLVDDGFKEMRGINFKDAPVDFMNRVNNPNVFDPAVNTKNFVQGLPSNIKTGYNKTKQGLAGLKDFLPFGPKSISGIALRGIGNLFQNIAPQSYGYSQRTYDAMTPGQQELADELYEPGGLLQGYNKISAFGRGPMGTLSNRLGTIQNTLAKQKVPSKVLQEREQQIKDAINKSINTGEREALGDPSKSVDYGITGGPTRTDIDVADGGAESGCFIKGTLITMADGSKKPVEQVDLEDEVAVGGKVFAVGRFLNTELYDYKGIKVSGSHMVNEEGDWMRVRDTKHGKSLGNDKNTVYVFGSENRRILINDILFTDYFEIEDQEQLLKEENKFFDNWKTFANDQDKKNVNTLNAS